MHGLLTYSLKMLLKVTAWMEVRGMREPRNRQKLSYPWSPEFREGSIELER